MTAYPAKRPLFDLWENPGNTSVSSTSYVTAISATAEDDGLLEWSGEVFSDLDASGNPVQVIVRLVVGGQQVATVQPVPDGSDGVSGIARIKAGEQADLQVRSSTAGVQVTLRNARIGIVYAEEL